MSKILTVPKGVKLEKVHPNFSKGFIDTLPKGTYPVVEVGEAKPTKNDKETCFFFVKIMQGNDVGKFGVFSGNPNIKGLKDKAEYSNIIVDDKKNILFQ